MPEDSTRIDGDGDTPEERRRAYKREWARQDRAKNPEKYRAKRRREYERHLEANRAKQLARYHADKERWQANNRRWRQENPDRVKELYEKRQRENPHHKRDYYRRNPEKLRQQNERRKRQCEYTPEALRYIPVLLSDPCSYCGEPADTIDHIEPISRGGGSDVDNLTAACNQCNGGKGAKPLLHFMLHRLL